MLHRIHAEKNYKIFPPSFAIYCNYYNYYDFFIKITFYFFLFPLIEFPLTFITVCQFSLFLPKPSR